jgi:uncharacterized protein with beta-barrel porin domain
MELSYARPKAMSEKGGGASLTANSTSIDRQQAGVGFRFT